MGSPDECHSPGDQLNEPDDDVEFTGDQILPDENSVSRKSKDIFLRPHPTSPVKLGESSHIRVLGLPELVDQRVADRYLNSIVYRIVMMIMSYFEIFSTKTMEELKVRTERKWNGW